MKLLPFLALFAISALADKPNILWLVQEDTSPWMGCYDYEAQIGKTPVIDKLAKDGVLFKRAYVPVGVCSACRSSFIVGANGFRFGAHEHRSRRGKAAKALPDGIKTLPELFVAAGYTAGNYGKTDYNFTGQFYSNSKKWTDQAQSGKPFFIQIQLKGGKTNTGKWPAARRTDPAKAVVPADYPQTEMYRKIIAQHCDAIRSDDDRIGSILKELDATGLADNTIVVYFSDHGANNLVRHKQQPTEAGLHVPLVIRGPAKYIEGGQVRTDLVSILDVSATSLRWAGIELPAWCEGQDLFSESFVPREFVGGARDRCDHTIDRIRTLRTDRYRYTRNFKLDRVFLQPQYRDNKDYLKYLRAQYAAGKLPEKLAEIYFGERPAEELYDISVDPAQINNLANSAAHKAELERHRALLDNWLAKGDLGAEEEPDVEMVINGNGRFKGVNPEYERVRSDSDGDGLSDRWERYNQRDPEDGRLQFEFDCGGWQTEGWASTGNLTNIAGSQGFLDFDLLAPKASITREGLKLDAGKNAGNLVVRVRATAATTLTFTANGKTIGSQKCAGNNEFAEITFPLAWSGTIESLELASAAPVGTTVEIDWMRVK